jgi:hypothetical protein
MAESTSRSSHKLEYTSSINTTTPSPTSTTTTYHSSFDYISEPRDCDTLVNMNQDINHNQHRPLERDLRRLDIDSNQRRIDTKNRKLDRTESISLPTTPTEQLSPACEYKYSRLLSLKNQINHNNNDDDDDDDDGPSFSCELSPDYMTNLSEQDFQPQITDELPSHSKK